MTNLRRARSYTRVGWLLTTLALAAALVVTSWVNYRGARAAVSTLNSGQATLLEVALREAFHPWNPLPDSAALRSFMEAHAEASVRYIALLDPEGKVLVSAGEPAGALAAPPAGVAPGPGAPLLEVGNRIRTYFIRPTFRGDRRGDGRDARRDGGRAGTPGEGQGPPRFGMNLVEFEPVAASGLITRARQSVALSGIVASILALAALVFWRMSERIQQARLHLEEQRRLSQLGEMSAVLAHEIRNPLASLKGNAQLLAERLPDDTRDRARAERIVREAVRLETLTTDLLDFARSGPIELRPADPAEVLRESAAELSEDGFELRAESAPERWTMDAARVKHALVNVLQNARQASPPDRPPLVRVWQERDGLVYEVRDFGPGLPPGSDGRLFDPFFTTRTNGTGLGLAVAKRVADMHQGQITARNHPEGGAVFRMVLPHLTPSHAES